MPTISSVSIRVSGTLDPWGSGFRALRGVEARQQRARETPASTVWYVSFVDDMGKSVALVS